MRILFAGGDRASLRHFDLSRNGSLRTLETTAESITAASTTASDFFRTVLSTVTSSALLDVIIVYRDLDLDASLHSCEPHLVCVCPWRAEVVNAPCYKWQFGVVREMHKTRDFCLVLCAEVIKYTANDAIRTLKRIVKANGGLGYLLHKPLVISEGRTPRSIARCSGQFPSTASAL